MKKKPIVLDSAEKLHEFFQRAQEFLKPMRDDLEVARRAEGRKLRARKKKKP